MTTPPTNLDSVTNVYDQRLLQAIGIELARSDGPFNQVTSSISIRATEYTLVVKGLKNIFAATLTPNAWKIPTEDKPRVTTVHYSTADDGVLVVVANKAAYDAMCLMEQRAHSSGSHDRRPAKRPRNS